LVQPALGSEIKPQRELGNTWIERGGGPPEIAAVEVAKRERGKAGQSGQSRK
jgi:hypothetical protein